MEIEYSYKIEKRKGDGMAGYGYSLMIYKNGKEVYTPGGIAYPDYQQAYNDFSYYVDEDIHENGRITKISITCENEISTT